MAIKKGNVKQIAKQSVNIVIGDKVLKRKRGKRRPRQTKAKGESQGLQGGFVTPIINYPPAYQPQAYQNPATVQSIQKSQAVSLVPQVPAGKPVGQARAKLVLPEGETAIPLGIEPQNPLELRLQKTESESVPISSRLKSSNLEESLSRVAEAERTGQAKLQRDIQTIFGISAAEEGVLAEAAPSWLLPEETYVETIPLQKLTDKSPSEIYIRRPVRGSSLPPISRTTSTSTVFGQAEEPLFPPAEERRRGRPKGSVNKPKPPTEPPTGPPPELLYETPNRRPKGAGKSSKKRGEASFPVEPPEEITFLGQPPPQRQEPTIERRRQPAGISAAEETFLG
jgi:hypothetical protein